MIIDLQKFIIGERPCWVELEALLNKLEREPELKMSLAQARQFQYLYQRASAGLARIATFSSEPQIRGYLESLVGRAYGQIHETRQKPHRVAPLQWFFRTFPRAFRRRIRAFWLALGIMLLGCVFGGLAICFDPEAKEVILPFPHLRINPAERVVREEAIGDDRLEGAKTSFSAYLMAHNIRVSIFLLALGMTWGSGTLIVLFSNGVILGAVALDYVLAGETRFLLGWLLPHGAVEIPACLLAGQAGLVLAGALIGWGERTSLKARLRQISSDLVTLIFGVAILLAWAGFVEAFLSQYHEPVVPYNVKIGFGLVELILLTLFLWKSGARNTREESLYP